MNINVLPENLIPVSCPRDCGGGCPMVAEMATDGRILKIRDNPLRPDKDYRLCPRGVRAGDEALDARRLTGPLKRTGERGTGSFQPLEWEDALDEIAEELVSFKNRYGSEALMLLGGSGSCRAKIHSPSPLARRFFSHWGRINDTKGYYSNTAENFAARSVFGGAGSGQDPETLTGTELVVLWGANICDLRFGPKLEPVLRRIKKNGVPFYVIDPRQTRTVRTFADGAVTNPSDPDSHWLSVRPGTDAALMAAVLFVWLSEGLTDEGFIKTYTGGFEPLREWVLGKGDGIPKDPDWASAVCGLSREQILSFARAYGKARPAALITGLSIQRCMGGEENLRMAMALQAARGNTGVPGGTSGSCLWNSMPRPKAVSPAVFLSSPEARYGADLFPINRWQDDYLEKNLKGIYAVGSNYANQSSDQKKSLSVFASSALTVCHDMFLTGTALWSDYVLPVTHFLERDDVVNGGENYIFFSSKALEPPGQAKDDLWIFSQLADRLGFGESFHQNMNADAWVDACIRRSAVDDGTLFKTSGFFDGGEHDRIALADFISDPVNNPLPTDDGKINFHCHENEALGFPAHPHYRRDGIVREGRMAFPGGESKRGTEEIGEKGRLQLLTPHAPFRTNSQHSQLPWTLKKEPPVIYIHPDDAAERGIGEGTEVLIENREGSLVLRAVFDPLVRRGVVWGYQGNWKLESSLNRLSSTESTMPSCGSRTHTIFVSISPAVDSDVTKGETE